MTVGDEHLGFVAANTLPNFAPPRDRIALTPAESRTLIDQVTAQRITGHLVAAIEAGLIDAGEDLRAEADRRHVAALALDLVLERLLVDTSTLFAAEGIRHRALKGPVLARTLYADPAQRSFGDIDVLVHSEDFDTAIASLTARGGRARYQEPRRRFTSRFGKGVCVITSSGYELDVHRVFVAGPFGLSIDAEDLFGDRCTIVVGDTPIPVLGPELAFLHACYHVALGNVAPRYSALRDVAEFLQTCPLDVDRVLSTAARWRGRAVVQRAVNLTRSRLPAVFDGPLIAWADAYVPDSFERTAVEAYVGAHASYAARAATGVWALPGLRRKVAYAGALLVPTRSYLRERDASYSRRWLRAIGLLSRRQDTP